MDSPALCARNCGFFGLPANQGLCSKCYNDYLKEQEKAVSVAEVVSQMEELKEQEKAVSVAEVVSQMEELKVQKHRCEVCNKKIGILGFVCKCDGVFCGKHRYPEAHSCDVDYKTQGKLMIEKQNQLCTADKLSDRI